MHLNFKLDVFAESEKTKQKHVQRKATDELRSCSIFSINNQSEMFSWEVSACMYA